MNLHLDAVAMEALGEAADAAGLSREAYVRRLVENQLGLAGRGMLGVGQQRTTGARFSAESDDARVRARQQRREKKSAKKRKK